jgi:cytochrome c-type biogenesis protein CcmH/NrfG
VHAVPALLPRIALALIAVVLVAWAAVLWMDQRTGDAASDRLLANPRMAEADFREVLDDYRRAERLDPGTDWRLTRAGALVLRGEDNEAANLTETVLEREPDNLHAWLVLREATRGRDPRRAAQASAEIRRLDPPVPAP